MIYLPNKFERYTASLRNYLQKQSLKYGVTPKILENMRKIYIAEAILYNYIKEPTDLLSLSSEILTAVYIKKCDKNLPFEFKIKIKGNFLISKKLYTSLILTLCQNAKKILIFSKNGKILIKAFGTEKKDFLPLAKVICASTFFELKSSTVLIVLDSIYTDKKEDDSIPNYTTDPFSVVNFFV